MTLFPTAHARFVTDVWVAACGIHSDGLCVRVLSHDPTYRSRTFNSGERAGGSSARAAGAAARATRGRSNRRMGDLGAGGVGRPIMGRRRPGHKESATDSFGEKSRTRVSDRSGFGRGPSG